MYGQFIVWMHEAVTCKSTVDITIMLAQAKKYIHKVWKQLKLLASFKQRTKYKTRKKSSKKNELA